MKNKGLRGITLIALAITIIVLLILSSVTISTLTGNNGIIENAVWAAFSAEMTDLDEQIAIKQIENSGELLNGETEQTIFTIPASLTNLPKSLKMEIIYLRENMPEDKEPTKEYYIEDLLDYLIDDTGNVKGLYYIPQEISGKNENYIYDELTNTAFKVKTTRLRGKTVHSYKYGCKVMGIGGKTELDENEYVLTEESEVVRINGEKYYAPNLEGFNALTTKAEYYSDDFSKVQEIGISLHMNKQVLNKIVDGNTTYTWYDYSEKKWANIKTTANGYEAWWVWIPRYAYKIESTSASEIGIIYVDTSGKPLDTEKYGETLPDGYEVHPAFTTDKELKGIWVSKYKPSYGKYKGDDVEMSQKGIVPDLTGFDKYNTYLIKYGTDGTSVESETLLDDVKDIDNFNQDKKWYDYENKIWANVKTNANGQESWWVWIPRYAYRLPDNPNDDTEIIFIDINNKPLDTEKYGNSIPDEFIVHPAFDQDADSNGNKLSGIWVSKYKPSYVKETENDEPMLDKYQIPDISGFDLENSYAIKYSSDGNTIESETKLSDIEDLQGFNVDKKWYDYENKAWANIKTTANGQEAWWVWIPRYAYRLPDNPNDDTEIIFVDINNKPLDTEKWTTLPTGFKVHPAFDQDTDGSGNKLSGIWVSKYKPSQK